VNVSETVRDDIRTTSDEIEAHAELLADLERRKQDPEANDEDLQRLAAQAEALAQRISEMTRIEKKLVDRVANS
jgi:RNA polymerase-interacting CarD/CdnL/TRCF family regulator